MFRKSTILATFMVVMGLFAAFAPSAFAKSTRTAFGQCGGSVFTGSQLMMSWQTMRVTPQAAQVAGSAGFHSMDNSLNVFMNQRVVRATLAASASPEDFGCHPGQLFSVGPRLIPKGTPVMVALPASLSKADASVVARKGFVRKMFAVHAVGKSNCSNPLRGVVHVWLWVKVQVKTVVPVKSAPKKNVVPKKPTGKTVVPKPVICILGGVPQYVVPSGFHVENNVCVANSASTDTTTKQCDNGKIVATNVNCNDATATATAQANPTINIIVTPPAPAPCNCTVPTPTPPPPPVTVSYSANCSSALTSDKSNRVASFTAGGTASNGVTASSATWTFFKNGTVVGTGSGLSTTFTFAENLTTYTATAVVRFSDGGTASCSTSIMTQGTPPPPPPG